MENIKDIEPLENAPDRGAYDNSLNYQRDVTNWLLKFVKFGNKIIQIFRDMKLIFSETNKLVVKAKQIDEQITNNKNKTFAYKQEAVNAMQTIKSVVIPTTATYKKEEIDNFVLESINANAVLGNLILNNQKEIEKLKI